jgi:hypothetical protein
MSSALPLNSDIARRDWPFVFVPSADAVTMCISARFNCRRPTPATWSRKRVKCSFYVNDTVAKPFIPSSAASFSRALIKNLPQPVRRNNALVPPTANGAHYSGGQTARRGCSCISNVRRASVTNKRLGQISAECILIFAKITWRAKIRLVTEQKWLSGPLGRAPHPHSVRSDSSNGYHAPMRIGAINAVPGTHVEIATASVRTELPAVPRRKDDVHPIVGERIDNKIKGMVGVLGIIAERIFMRSVKYGPRIDENPRSLGLRQLTQRPNDRSELIKDV